MTSPKGDSPSFSHEGEERRRGQSRQFPWPAAIIAGAVVLFAAYYLGFELNLNGRLGFPLDDPWIHLTFAKNLARGWGFAYNQGEPVQGSSAPLWTLILAFFHLFTKNVAVMVWITKLLGVVFLYVAALFGYRIVLRVTRNRWAGLAAGIGLATLSHLNWAMVSGMEVTLTLALVLAGTFYYVTAPRNWKSYLPWVLFALAVYSRPESLLFPVFVTLDVIIRRIVSRAAPLTTTLSPKGRGKEERPKLQAHSEKVMSARPKVGYWRGLLAYLVALLPYFALNLTLVHSLFPQTYVAKIARTSLFGALASGDAAQLRLLLLKSPFTYFGGFFKHLWTGNPIFVLLGIAGLAAMIAEFAKRKGTASLFIPLMALLYAPLLGMTAPFVRPAFQNGRYLGSPVGAFIIMAGVGAFFLVDRVKRRTARLALIGGLVLLAAFNTISTAPATARNTALAESSINRQQVAVGEWLNANTPPNSLIACNDVGAIGYLSNRRVLDLLGLVTPDIVPYRQRDELQHDGSAYIEYLKMRKPDYLAIFPNWFPGLERAIPMKSVHVSDMPDNYASEFDLEPQLKSFAGILITGLPMEPARATMVVYQCDWSNEGKP